MTDTTSDAMLALADLLEMVPKHRFEMIGGTITADNRDLIVQALRAAALLADKEPS